MVIPRAIAALSALCLPLVSALLYQTKMKPCPVVTPSTDAETDQLLGSWHLALLVLDATEEDFVEADVCVRGVVERANSTVLRQVWTADTNEQHSGREGAVVELRTVAVEPGVWAVQMPLGGQVVATIFAAHPTSHMLVTHCAWHHGSLVHLWTAAVTRSPAVSNKLRILLTKALIRNGFNPATSKVISWHNC